MVKYGVAIGKLQRRAGRDYSEAMENLKTQGRLEIIKGRFIRCISHPHTTSTVEYEDIDGNPIVLPGRIRVVINCSGFQDITKSTSALIQSLIKENLAVPTEANRGFEVNEEFEVSKNCFLIGPLIAGNCNQKFRIWHAESCERIIGLATQFAEVLTQRLHTCSEVSRERALARIIHETRLQRG